MRVNQIVQEMRSLSQLEPVGRNQLRNSMPASKYQSPLRPIDQKYQDAQLMNDIQSLIREETLKNNSMINSQRKITNVSPILVTESTIKEDLIDTHRNNFNSYSNLVISGSSRDITD